MKSLYTAKVMVVSGRNGSAQSNDHKLNVQLAFPQEIGGTGDGTNPEQLIAADDGGYDLSVKLEVSAKGQSREMIEELIAKAKTVCAYSRSTKGLVPSTIIYKSDEP